MRMTPLLALIAFATSSAVFAGSVAEERKQRHEQLDSNQDGQLAPDEYRHDYKQEIRELWQAHDENQDGQLDEAEFARFEETLDRNTAPPEPERHILEE